MYTKEQVDEVLSQVEQEIQKSLGMIKSENTTSEEVSETEEVKEEVIAKSEENSEEELDYSQEDFETIDEIYSGMSKSEKEAHYNAVKKALFGEEKEMAKSESEKTETVETKEETKEESSLLKTEMDSIKSENEELKKSMETMAELITKLMAGKKAPSRKAVTGTDYIAKSEDSETKESKVDSMSKSEITSKLKSLDYSSLTKSDREAINNFYLKNTGVGSIKHLIKE